MEKQPKARLADLQAWYAQKRRRKQCICERFDRLDVSPRLPAPPYFMTLLSQDAGMIVAVMKNKTKLPRDQRKQSQVVFDLIADNG